MDQDILSFSLSDFKYALEDYRNELFSIYHLITALAVNLKLIPNHRHANDAVNLDKLPPEVFSALLDRARYYSIIEEKPTKEKHRIRPFAHRYLHPASHEVVQGKEQRRKLIASMRKNRDTLTKLRAKVRELNQTKSPETFKRAFNEALKLTGMPSGLFSVSIENVAPSQPIRQRQDLTLAPRLLLITPRMQKELSRFGLSADEIFPSHPLRERNVTVSSLFSSSPKAGS